MKKMAIILTILGIGIVVLSHKIVFPGLEHLLGIETIVGNANVHYFDAGGYVYTNPRAMMGWTLSVALIGSLIASTGILLLIRAKRKT
jgi:hypothetical protein